MALGPCATSTASIVGRAARRAMFKLSYLVTAWTQRPEDEHRLLSTILGVRVRYDALPREILVGLAARADRSHGVTVALPPPRTARSRTSGPRSAASSSRRSTWSSPPQSTRGTSSRKRPAGARGAAPHGRRAERPEVRAVRRGAPRARERRPAEETAEGGRGAQPGGRSEKQHGAPSEQSRRPARVRLRSIRHLRAPTVLERARASAVGGFAAPANRTPDDRFRGPVRRRDRRRSAARDRRRRPRSDEEALALRGTVEARADAAEANGPGAAAASRAAGVRPRCLPTSTCCSWRSRPTSTPASSAVRVPARRRQPPAGEHRAGARARAASRGTGPTADGSARRAVGRRGAADSRSSSGRSSRGAFAFPTGCAHLLGDDASGCAAARPCSGTVPAAATGIADTARARAATRARAWSTCARRRVRPRRARRRRAGRARPRRGHARPAPAGDR